MSCARKIKVMFYGIMKKWRYCVAFVIAFAILLTAFAFIKEVKKTGESEEVIAENTELKNIAEAKLKDYQDQKEEYIKKAENAKKIIAATDNVEISEALFNIGVIGGSNEESRQTELEEIQYIYYAAINNIALYDDIAKENNLDVPSTVLRTIVRQDYKNSSLIVSCKGLTKELNDKIRDRVADVVIKTGEKLNAVEKTHSLDLISKTSANVYGEVYSTVQKQINTELDAMDESIKTQQGAVNAYTNTVNDATKINFKKVIEYLFVGAIAGFGIFLILSIICGIFDNKIYSADDMAINYNIAPLGKFAVKNKKYRSKFDRYIDKLFNINTPVITALNGDKITKAAQENSTSKLIIVALTEEEKEVIKEKSAIAGYELTEEFSPDADRKEFIIKRFDEVNDTDFTAPLSVIVAVNYGTAKFGALNRVFIELERLSANVIGFVGIENIEE